MINVDDLFSHSSPPVRTTIAKPLPIPKPVFERDVVVTFDTTGPWPAEHEPWPDPCERCGTLELWQNALGRWRCLRCDPPTKAIRALERVERIRRQQATPEACA